MLQLQPQMPLRMRRIKMSKFAQYLLLASMFSGCFVVSVQATLKFDVSKPVTKVMQNVEKVQGIAADTQKQLEHVKTYQKMLDGAKEGMEKFNELKKEYNDTMSAVNDVKNSADGLKSSVADGVNQANSLTGSMADANQLLNLQTQQAEMQKQYEKEVKELEDSRDAQIKALQTQNAELKEMLGGSNHEEARAKIDANDKEINELMDHYEKLIADKKLVYDRAQSSLTGQMNQLKEAATNIDQLSNVTSDLKDKAVSSLFGGNAAVAMNEMMAKNFYKADEEESTDRSGEIMDYRYKKEREDAAAAYQEAVQIMSAGDEHLTYAKSLQSNAQVTETEPAAIMLDISIKIEQMRELLKFARLLAAEMKMESAKDIVNVNKRLNDYTKDVQNFRMDDYDVDPKKKLKDKLKDISLSDIKNTVNKAKDKLNDAKEIYQDVNDGVDIIKGFSG